MARPKRRQKPKKSDLKKAEARRKGRPAPAPKEDAIEVEGKVVDCLPNLTFRLELENGHRLLARLAGRMRRNRIRVSLGDSVKVEISPYDMERGRITFRL